MIGRKEIMGSWGNVYVSVMCRPDIIKFERESLVHVIFLRFFVVFSMKNERNRMEKRGTDADTPGLHESGSGDVIGARAQAEENERMYLDRVRG